MTIESQTFVWASVLVVAASTALAPLQYHSFAQIHTFPRALPVTWALRWTDFNFRLCLRLLNLFNVSISHLYCCHCGQCSWSDFTCLFIVYLLFTQLTKMFHTAIDNWNLRLIYLWLNRNFFYTSAIRLFSTRFIFDTK